MRVDEGDANALHLGAGEFHERRPHRRARQPPQEDQRLLHAIMHICPGVGVEGARERIDAIIEALGFSEVLPLHRGEELGLQIGNDAAAAGKEPIAAQHEGAQQPGAMGGSTLTGG